MERCSYGAEVSDEPPVKVSKSQELLNKTAIRCRPLSHSDNFRWIHLYLSRGYDEAEERYCVSMKLTLFSFNIQLVLQQPLEDLTYMGNMRV